MFNEIKLTNFKCFQGEVAFPLSKINLLTGINGRGKSSFLQSLLLFKQSVEKDKYTTALHLNGDYVRLETYEDVLNRNKNADDFIEIDFSYNNALIKFLLNEEKYDEKIINLYNVYITFRGEKGDIITEIENIDDTNLTSIHNYTGSKRLKIEPSSLFHNLLPNKEYYYIIDGSNNTSKPYYFFNPFNKDFFKTIHYISADRIGPLFRHDKKPTNGFLTLTPNGDNATSIFVKSKLLDIKQGICIGENSKLQHQTNAWLSYIFDTNVKIEVSEYEGTLFLKFEINNEKHKPTNVGFGYSCILPILLAGMIAEDGHTLIIENPEAHLHPKAQARLTEFLARVATAGVQIFIESHSEHILNGLRVAIAKNEIGLKNTDVSVLYFSENAANGHFDKVEIGEKGDIETWHTGFFDQTNLDYKVLYDY